VNAGRWRQALVLALVLVVAVPLLSSCVGRGGRTVTVQLRDAAGLFEGNDVGVLGVRVGEVEEVVPRGGHVDVVLHLDDGVDVPADASAVVVSRSVATDRYVELTPVHRGGPTLRDGAVIPLERTRTPVEFDELLATLESTSSALGADGGDALDRLLEASAANLDGNGATVRDGMADLSDVLGTIDGRLGDVEGTLVGLDRLTTALAEDDAVVRRFVEQVADATVMLDEQQESIEATFDAVTAMVEEVGTVVRAQRGRVSAQMDDFVALAQDLAEREADYQQLLDTGPLMLQNLVRAIDENDRLSFRTRPLDLVPGRTVVGDVCDRFPAGACERLGLLDLPLWTLLETLAGVTPR
jgi:virulence factor Mce-like protein